jgi:hypothetical protein
MTRERRKSIRVQWHSSAMIYDREGDLGYPCVLSDFSNGGAKITGVTVGAVPDHFTLRMARGLKRRCHVLWRSTDALGVEFTHRLASPDGSNVDDKRKPTRRPVHTL